MMFYKLQLSHSVPTGATGAANAVYVAVGIFRNIEIKHMAYHINIQSPGCQSQRNWR